MAITLIGRKGIYDGGILQLVSAQSVAAISTSNTSATEVSALTCSITPTESGNKIIWNMHGGHMSYNTSEVRLKTWLYIKVGSGSAANAHPSGGDSKWTETNMASTFGHSTSMHHVYTTTNTDTLEFTPYIASSNGSYTCGLNYSPYVITATVMEIKA
tara:strand:+ start:171 stop:644 length:474 start_codon:yes stop_codon:yes gene_type:complete